MTALGVPLTFPISEKVQLLLDTERIDEALEQCDRLGHALEVRTPAVR